MDVGVGRPPATSSPEPVAVRLPITLGQFLKLTGLAPTGGDAKLIISAGRVTVNGLPETRRGRQLEAGATVAIDSGPPCIVTEDGPLPA